MRKIALTGAHGTGKTTLVSALFEVLRQTARVGRCREAPRLIIEYLGENDFFRREKNTPERQGLIFLEHVFEEARQGNSHDFLITDRTLVDHLAYTAVLFPKVEGGSEFRTYQRLSYESLAGYNKIYKIPIEFPVRDDGVRESEVGFQQSVDKKIDELYGKSGTVPKIIRGTVQERVDSILSDLQIHRL